MVPIFSFIIEKGIKEFSRESSFLRTPIGFLSNGKKQEQKQSSFFSSILNIVDNKKNPSTMTGFSVSDDENSNENTISENSRIETMFDSGHAAANENGFSNLHSSEPFDDHETDKILRFFEENNNNSNNQNFKQEDEPKN